MFLEQGGAEVYVTRDEDKALGESKWGDMKKRIEAVMISGTDIMVSIHQNSFTNKNAKGAQVFYFSKSEEGKLLAQYVQKSLTDILDEKNQRVAKENSSYYILKHTEIPAVIIECGFLSNPQEEKSLNNEEYQLRAAWAIYDGICSYFEEKDSEKSDSSFVGI